MYIYIKQSCAMKSKGSVLVVIAVFQLKKD